MKAENLPPRYVYNYSKLLGRIKEKFGTQEKFALSLGIGRVSLSQCLNGRVEFSQSEILRACELLKISKNDVSEYFLNTDISGHNIE